MASEDSRKTAIGALRGILRPRNPAGRNPLMRPSPDPSCCTAKKKGFAAAVAFRGLGCSSASASQAYSPEASAVRSSSDWQPGNKRSTRRRAKQKRRRERCDVGSTAAAATSAADIWCAPGIAFGADDLVDCVVAHHPQPGRGFPDNERSRREPIYLEGHENAEEEFSSTFDGSTSILEAPLFGSNGLVSGRLSHGWGYRRSPDCLEEILMFRARLLLGEMELHDQYSDLRLDVDNMSYEELLELGEKIGHVSTGLREEDIFRGVQKAKHAIFEPASTSTHLSSLPNFNCSICQEEYSEEDELGNLECGHSYHLCCIKEWLLRKNACPLCNTSIQP